MHTSGSIRIHHRRFIYTFCPCVMLTVALTTQNVAASGNRAGEEAPIITANPKFVTAAPKWQPLETLEKQNNNAEIPPLPDFGLLLKDDAPNWLPNTGHQPSSFLPKQATPTPAPSTDMQSATK